MRTNKLFLILSVPLALSCARVESHTPEAVKPLVVAVDYDGTRSATDLPALTSDHLDELTKIVNRRGGTIAFILIDDHASGLLRLELAPVRGRLDDRAERAVRNRQVISEWKARVLAQAKPPRSARWSDLQGSLGHLDSFFRETMFPADAEKILLIISDGVHDLPKQRNQIVRASLPADVKVLAIGMDTSVATKTFGERVVLFGSIEAALDKLASSSVD